MPDRRRVMVLSLDAADPTLVREFAAAGQMPTMARLLREAGSVDTLAPPGTFVSSNWPTIFTALRPDRHQYLCWDEIRGGSYEHVHTTPHSVRGTPFWERLSEAGRRVAVLDVPHTIARPVDGAMVVEWGCHDRHHGTASWPPELAAELTARHGVHLGGAEPPGFDQFAPCDYTHRVGAVRTAGESEALFRALCDGLEVKRAAALDLLDRGDWDLFFNVMGESHCVGHQLWHLHDAAHRFHDAALAARMGGDPVLEIYQRLDGVLADHLARVGPEDTAYVLFAHGMTAHHDGTHVLDHVLHRLDWGLDTPGGLGGFTRAAGALAARIPRALRGPALRSAAPLLRARAAGDAPAALPWLAERRWFATPNNTVVGAVRLNLIGREPQGRIDPDDRREALRWLAERFEELVNVDTGGRAVTRCEITDDVYRRTPDDAFGDLFVEWNRTAPIERVWSPAIGTIALPYDHWRQGDHVREGLLLARGPGIAPGRRRGVHETIDLAPTFSAALGVTLPDVDGHPIHSLVPGGAAPARRAVARAAVGARLRRGAARRVPQWANREDLAGDRLRTDVAAAAAGAAAAHAGAAAAQASADAAQAAAAAAQARAEAATAELDATRERVAQLERQATVGAMIAWLRQADVPEDLLVSVVLPTRDRCELLAAAIASVEAQSYARWELLVVDDGSTDGTAEFLAGLADARVRVLRADGVGVCAARNLALELARGDVIVYLDDDNRFDRDWMKAVARAFLAFPERDVCYGARVIDDDGRLLHGVADGRPLLHFLAWDPAAIRTSNLADMNVMAHRRSLARFDETLAYLGDWDLLLTLTAGNDPVELPAIAVYYRTDALPRLTTSISDDEMQREYRRVREKLAVETP